MIVPLSPRMHLAVPLILLSAGFLAWDSACSSTETQPPPLRSFEPAFDRLAPRPDWELDITDRLVREDGEALSEVFGPIARSSRVRGGSMSWKAEIELPEGHAGGNWPLVLEADESRAIEAVAVNGQPLGKMSLAGRGGLLSSGEGWVLLRGAEKPFQFSIRALDLPHIYPNGFGRLRIRPATVDEAVELQNEKSGRVKITNRSDLPLTGRWVWQAEDYFGVPLLHGGKDIAVSGGESVSPEGPTLPKETYRVRHQLVVNGKPGLEYWEVFDAEKTLRSRPEVLRLSSGWSYVFSDKPIDSAKPPEEGWSPVPRIPFRPQGDEYKSHWMWVKTTVQIPEDWNPANRLRLLIPTNIHYRGRILWDGQEIGNAANWELPAKFEIPGRLVPGSKHTLMIGITDHIVGLVEGAKVPGPGPMAPPGRGVAAPMSTTGPMRIAFDAIPELEAVPQKAIERVVVRTQVVPEKTIDAEVFTDASWNGKVRAAVYAAGQLVLDLGEQTAKDGVVWFAKPWADAPLWSLDSPRLLELRLELVNSQDEVVDTFRERFGFREFGISDGTFTLNGAPIQLLGGSHIYITNLLWPVRSHPYNFVRHGFTGSEVITGGTSSGVAAMNAADETGYLLKAADWNVNAHCADTYAWERPEIWERLRSTWRQATSTYANHPSVVMWDIANEVSFRREGEDVRMGELMKYIRELDPTRLVTIGGSFPSVSTAEVLNNHGWGAWNNRTDFWFGQPERRPSYLQNSGYYADKPEGEPTDKWTLDRKDLGTAPQLLPGGSRELRHAGGAPILFAEGHYYESNLPFALMGHDATLPLGTESGWSRFHALNILGTRTRSIANVRQGGIKGSMIHVDRGVGRAILPLAVFSKDRQTRFRVGEPLRTTLELHANLRETTKVHVRIRLFNGKDLLGENEDSFEVAPFSTRDIPVEFPAPASEGTLRLEIRAWPEGSSGWFSDDLLLRVFPQPSFVLPKGQSLEVFDPAGKIANFLSEQNIPFQKIETLGAWKPAPNSTLLVGPEALAGVTASDLAGLAPKVAEGGRIIVLSQTSLPQFLRTRLAQSREFNSHAARMDFDSPIARGLTTEDLRAWQTREGDQLVSMHPLDSPAVGNFRTHVTTVKSAPVLEVGEGNGRVLFVQMNLDGALGLDPAADRMFANILSWTAEPSPFQRQEALILAQRHEVVRPLTTRLGLEGEVTKAPIRDQILKARLIVLDGGDPALRPALDKVAADLRKALSGGANLYITGLDPEGAGWLSKLLETEIRVSAYPHQFARLTEWNSPVTAGLGHADFLLTNLNDQFNDRMRARGEGPFTALTKVSGGSLRPLLEPAYLAELPVGKGRVVLDQTAGLVTPLPALSRITSTVLSNLGAILEPGGSGREDSEKCEFQPVDLTNFVNRSLTDSDAGNKARGWNASGEDNDLREFPTGRQNLRGVEFFITPPDKASGNSMIALSGASPKLEGLPEKVEGIPVNAKADRLYFLHVSVWGVPGFTYRVYYKEDRAKWIPGQPDPFVDVRVKPRENILDWVDAKGVERGETFMPGGSVAWLGGTKRTRETSATGGTDVGVFQMAWDNPHPEKTIESIDIISAGEEGSGHPFVLGITAARRQSGSAAPPPAALESVLPETIRPERVAYHGRTESLGYVLLNDGTIASIYDNEGRRFASSRGWVLEASREGGTRSILARQARQKPEITTRREPGRTIHEIRGNTPQLEYLITLTASGAGLRYDIAYTPIELPVDAGTLRLVTGLQLDGADTKGAEVNEMPVPINTPGGRVLFTFDRRYLTWVFSYFVSEHEVGLVSPPKNAPAMANGVKEELWWELSMP